ncbi:MAG: hypothetical protein MZV70_44755 [Desulfobacterales bacterium]|nr:hypothetical protein [Desulfobacterales bacterium]
MCAAVCPRQGHQPELATRTTRSCARSKRCWRGACEAEGGIGEVIPMSGGCHGTIRTRIIAFCCELLRVLGRGPGRFDATELPQFDADHPGALHRQGGCAAHAAGVSSRAPTASMCVGCLEGDCHYHDGQLPRPRSAWSTCAAAARRRSGSSRSRVRMYNLSSSEAPTFRALTPTEMHRGDHERSAPTRSAKHRRRMKAALSVARGIPEAWRHRAVDRSRVSSRVEQEDAANDCGQAETDR